MSGGHVAVIDIGKTNAKLALVDPETLAERAVLTRPNAVRPGPPWPHFDVEGHWHFLLEGLAQMHRAHGIAAISVTTHGAALALLDAALDLAAPILDYEHPGPETLAAAYDAIRPPFSETGAPRLPGGLNAGAQLHWQLSVDPDLAGRIRHVVTYPQYWGARLTGEVACDVTSLGCHTDLWNPHRNQPSALPGRLGLADRLAPPRRPQEVLGPLRAGLAARTGLPPGLPVHCGIHDSNASLLPHLLRQTGAFGVVSTGTWVIAMAMGGRPVTLTPDRDTLVNVNALGDPVPSARFMGGREHDLLMGGHPVTPTPADLAQMAESGPMLLPAVLPGSGPFPGRTARWIGGAEPAQGTGARAACAGFYLALMTATCLDLVGHDGPLHVEGPFARNPAYLAMLAAATGSPVHAADSATGTSTGAALLALGATAATLPAPAPPVLPDPSGAMAAYARAWRAQTC